MGIELGRAFEALKPLGLEAAFEKISGSARAVLGLDVRVAAQIGERRGRFASAVPLPSAYEASLCALPQLWLCGDRRGIRERGSRCRRVAGLLAEVAQPLEQLRARDRIFDSGGTVSDDLRRLTEQSGLLKQTRRRGDCAVVFRD